MAITAMVQRRLPTTLRRSARVPSTLKCRIRRFLLSGSSSKKARGSKGRSGSASTASTIITPACPAPITTARLLDVCGCRMRQSERIRRTDLPPKANTRQSGTALNTAPTEIFDLKLTRTTMSRSAPEAKIVNETATASSNEPIRHRCRYTRKRPITRWATTTTNKASTNDEPLNVRSATT